MNIHSLFAFVATAFALASYVPYIRDIRAGKTKPHIFSWTIWGLMTGIYFFAQLSEGAGIGSVVTGITAVICIYIVFASFKQSEKNIKTIDWICLGISLIALVSWLLTKTPNIAVILITIADLAAFIPTFRKVYTLPYSETLATFAMSGIKHFLSVFALEQITFGNSFYTFYLILVNAAIVGLIVWRRRK